MEDRQDQQRILENIEEYITSGLSKRVATFRNLKLLAFSDPFPIESRTALPPGAEEKLTVPSAGRLFSRRAACSARTACLWYDPKAISPDRWLTLC